ncbi:hypothetical protein [Agrobacterium fabrum]|uniref:hypothetical protein n=1 Tax=Agrobacterium fabrum TaxID=1176649 RepID=UPI001FCEF19D|nr:hypothetical protein [Agrobacterium fabrum]WCK79822.1 hypothetical protein G6L39_023140 [Agrobacterium fabrum]
MKITLFGGAGPAGFSWLLGPSGEGVAPDEALNPQLAERLWDMSIQMTGIDARLLLVNRPS